MTLNLLKFGACALFGLNIASNFSTGKELGGKSNVEVSKQFDTLLTPDGWAFSIWSVIFIGEALGLVYLCNVQSTLTGVLVPFMYATLFQSLWSIAFSRELLLASALILTFISYSLYQCCNELQVAQLTVFGQLLIAYPIRIHWAWSTAAALVNWNMFLVSLNYPFDQGYEVIAAFASVWLAAGVASYRALFMSDGVFPAVMAWTFAWMSSKIRHNPPLVIKHDYALRDLLETTYDLLSVNMWCASIMSAVLTYSFWYLNLGLYEKWITSWLARFGTTHAVFWLYLFAVWHISIAFTIYSRRGRLQWR